MALGLSCDVLEERYDAIVVDEGQDFGDDFWLPLEMLLSDPADAYLYVFYDPNQSLYRPPEQCPVPGDPFPLTVNCRNTQHIHDAAYRYYIGEPTDPCEIDGVPVDTLTADVVRGQAELIARRVAELLGEHRVPPREVSVLVAGEAKDAHYEAIGRLPLPGGRKWAFEDHSLASDRVLVETVGRFKGLECGIGFLWLPPRVDPVHDREWLYVGTSRARSRLVLVGTAAACRAAATGPVHPGGTA
jgi:hypothetical protein